jgi:hypothetical protein
MLPSLMASSMEWEWQSTIPGMRYLPVASITRAFPALRFFPTAAIFPLRISTSAFGSVPRVTVSTVALRISVSGMLARPCAKVSEDKNPANSKQVRK